MTFKFLTQVLEIDSHNFKLIEDGLSVNFNEIIHIPKENKKRNKLSTKEIENDFVWFSEGNRTFGIRKEHFANICRVFIASSDNAITD